MNIPLLDVNNIRYMSKDVIQEDLSSGPFRADMESIDQEVENINTSMSRQKNVSSPKSESDTDGIELRDYLAAVFNNIYEDRDKEEVVYEVFEQIGKLKNKDMYNAQAKFGERFENIIHPVRKEISSLEDEWILISKNVYDIAFMLNFFVKQFQNIPTLSEYIEAIYEQVTNFYYTYKDEYIPGDIYIEILNYVYDILRYYYANFYAYKALDSPFL